MASEDNFLRLDPFNYDTEIEWLVATDSISLDDCEALYQNGQMSQADYEYAKDWFEFYKE